MTTESPPARAVTAFAATSRMMLRYALGDIIATLVPVCWTTYGTVADEGTNVGALAKFFKSLFAPKPVQANYTHLSDGQLQSLWRDRDQLTSDAKDALRSEAERRTLVLETGHAKKPATKSTWAWFEEADRRRQEREKQLQARPTIEPMEPHRIIVVAPFGVAVRTQGTRAVLCVLPIREANTKWTENFKIDADLVIEAIVACNESESGFLPVAWIAARLGVTGDAVFAIDASRAADRPLPGLGTRGGVPARRMPKRLDLGFLRLRALHNGSNTLMATWSDPHGDVPERVLMGPAVRFEEVISRQANIVVGGLVVPEPTQPIEQALMMLRQVVLMLDVVGVVPWAETIALLGVHAKTVGNAAAAENVVGDLTDGHPR